MGVVLQAELHRTRAGRCGASTRLGARDPARQGRVQASRSRSPITKKADVDAAYVRLMKMLLSEGHYPAIATHDPAMIDVAQQYRGASTASAPDRFEFQMLYGIRRDLQSALVADGLPRARLHPVRPPVVPVLHAPPRRTPRQRRVRPARHPPRTIGTRIESDIPLPLLSQIRHRCLPRLTLGATLR